MRVEMERVAKERRNRLLKSCKKKEEEKHDFKRLDSIMPEFQGVHARREKAREEAKRNFISITARLNKARFNRWPAPFVK